MLVSAVILYSSVPYFGVDIWLVVCGCDNKHHDQSNLWRKGFVSPPVSGSQSCLREVRKEIETGAEAEAKEEGGPLALLTLLYHTHLCTTSLCAVSWRAVSWALQRRSESRQFLHRLGPSVATPSSQVTLGCVRLTIETDHDKRSVDLVALCGMFA